MKKILIAFLGNTRYQNTTYRIEDRLYKNKLAFIPIFEHFAPVETVYVIGTKESRWEMLSDFPHKRIEIPYGRSESDFWKMFDILTNKLILKQAKVIFDITHCFRAIPIFSAIYIRFFRYLEPTAEFSHIFYGSFEKDNPETPIVDLAPVLELFDWIDATTSFIKYGELDDLSLRVKGINNKVWKSDTESKPIMLGEFSKKLEKLSNLSRLTYIPLLPETSSEMSNLLNKKEFHDEISRFVKPFNLLTERLIKYTSRFAKSSFWESHLEAAKWYLDNKRPTQALLVLREIILTYLCEKDGCDPYNFKSRETRERELNEKRRYSKKPIVKLWGKITDARNRAGHALMKRPDKELSINRAINEVALLVAETERILVNLP